MKLRYSINVVTVVTLVLTGAVACAPNAVPKAGVMVEPVQGNGGPEAKFTNRTADDLAIICDNEKFLLKSGGTKNIPIPQQQAFDLKIFEKQASDSQFFQRFEGKVTRNAQKRFIPFPWAKPNK